MLCTLAPPQQLIEAASSPSCMYGLCICSFSAVHELRHGSHLPAMILTAPLLQPIYKSMFGIHIFGLGFLTSMAFIFMTGELSAAGAGLRPACCS